LRAQVLYIMRSAKFEAGSDGRAWRKLTLPTETAIRIRFQAGIYLANVVFKGRFRLKLVAERHGPGNVAVRKQHGPRTCRATIAVYESKRTQHSTQRRNWRREDRMRTVHSHSC